MHDAVVSKLIAASRGSPRDSKASCLLVFFTYLTFNSGSRRPTCTCLLMLCVNFVIVISYQICDRE